MKPVTGRETICNARINNRRDRAIREKVAVTKTAARKQGDRIVGVVG